MNTQTLHADPADAALAADRRVWDRTAKKYAADPVADPGGYQRTLDRIGELLDPRAEVLEVGCGTGATALALGPRAAHWTATDISGQMIEIARGKAEAAGIANVGFERAAIGDPRFEGEGFDAVIALNILHLVPDLGAALGALARTLKPGGLLISKTPCLKEMNPLVRLAIPAMRLVGKAPASVLSLAAADITAALASAGFATEAQERHATRGNDIRPFIVARKHAS